MAKFGRRHTHQKQRLKKPQSELLDSKGKSCLESLKSSTIDQDVPRTVTAEKATQIILNP
jgi:hypothetical protein